MIEFRLHIGCDCVKFGQDRKYVARQNRKCYSEFARGQDNVSLVGIIKQDQSCAVVLVNYDTNNKVEMIESPYPVGVINELGESIPLEFGLLQAYMKQVPLRIVESSVVIVESLGLAVTYDSDTVIDGLADSLPTIVSMGPAGYFSYL